MGAKMKREYIGRSKRGVEVEGEKVRGHNGKDKKGGQNIKQLSVNFKRPENCVGFVFRVEIF